MLQHHKTGIVAFQIRSGGERHQNWLHLEILDRSIGFMLHLDIFALREPGASVPTCGFPAAKCSKFRCKITVTTMHLEALGIFLKFFVKKNRRIYPFKNYLYLPCDRK